MKKVDLALAYFPEKKPAQARDKLCSWIKECKPLMKELSATGYRNKNREFTPKQIALIYYWLGEP